MQEVKTNDQRFLCVAQPVLVEAGVVTDYATIIQCDVVRDDYGTRDGIAWIDGRPAKVSQRYPGYDPSFEWFFDGWADI